MYSVFRGWNFMERLKLRRICFKGGSNEIKETSAQVASADVALQEFNHYMKTIQPFEDKFMGDVSADTAGREAQVAGRISADIAQKVGSPTSNPNRGMGAESVSDLATATAKAQVTGNQAVKAQQAAGLQTVIDMGQGKASTAQLGLDALAGQSVSEAANSAMNNEKVQDANMSSGATGLGIAAGLSTNLYKDSLKKK